MTGKRKTIGARRGAAAVLIAALALSVAGCGSDEDADPNPQAQIEAEEAAQADSQDRWSAVTPKEAKRLRRTLESRFPRPKPDRRISGSEEAISAGENACGNRTPLEVKEAYFPTAVQLGVLDEEAPPGSAIAETREYVLREIARGEPDPSMAAAQLAAAAYSATLPPEVARYGAGGCIHALARQLASELPTPSP